MPSSEKRTERTPRRNESGPGRAKLREAEGILAHASLLLKDAEPKSRWYACNKLYHGAYKLAERIEREAVR